VTTDATGAFTTTFAVPNNQPRGLQPLVASGLGPNGQPTSATTGVNVPDPTCPIPPVGTPTVQVISVSGPCPTVVGTSGSGFKPNTVVTLTLGNPAVTIGTVTTDANGAFSISFTIPLNQPVGLQPLVASGTGTNGQPVSATTTVDVPASSCASSGAPGGSTGAPGGSTGVEVLGEQVTHPATAEQGPLPFTGAAGTALLVAIGLGFLVIGSITVIAARRRVRSS
jgi:hypothetical protein